MLNEEREKGNVFKTILARFLFRSLSLSHATCSTMQWSVRWNDDAPYVASSETPHRHRKLRLCTPLLYSAFAHEWDFLRRVSVALDFGIFVQITYAFVKWTRMKYNVGTWSHTLSATTAVSQAIDARLYRRDTIFVIHLNTSIPDIRPSA